MVKRLRYFAMIICSLLGVNLLIFANVSAASCSGVDTAIIDCNVGGDGGIFYILSLVLDILAIGVGILGVVGIVWAGILYLTAGGDVARTAKAKKRLFEIMVGILLYVVIYSFATWLLPGMGSGSSGGGGGGGGSSSSQNVIGGNTHTIVGWALPSSDISKISITYKGKAYIGEPFTPKVTFNKGASDKTYTLKSGNTTIAKTSGTSVECLKVGRVKISAIASNGKKGTVSIKCQKKPNEYDGPEATTGSMMNTNLKNGTPRLRKETRKIISDHRMDFFYNNFSSVIASKGGYKKYVKSLGGVFAKYADLNKFKIKTAADFQIAAEYVWGLMTIWGPDYAIGRGTPKLWLRGQAYKNGKNDGFYSGLPSRNSINTRPGDSGVNKILSESSSVRTNCNDTIDIFKLSTNLSGGGCGACRNERTGITITNAKDLRVGDIVDFYSTTGYNSDSWNHVAVVGEVYKDFVVFYDGGSRFTNTANYKKVSRRDKGCKLTDDYGQYGCGEWRAHRPWNIDQKVTLKGIN